MMQKQRSKLSHRTYTVAAGRAIDNIERPLRYAADYPTLEGIGSIRMDYGAFDNRLDRNEYIRAKTLRR